MPSQRQCKVALTGDVALEVVSSYFRDAGFDVMPQDSPKISGRAVKLVIP